jgi:hypothetical protein
MIYIEVDPKKILSSKIAFLTAFTRSICYKYREISIPKLLSPYILDKFIPFYLSLSFFSL